MTTVLDEPADLLKLVGQPLGTTEWMKLIQPQVDLFAQATGDHQWIHAEPQRRQGPVRGERRLRIPHAVTRARSVPAGAADPGPDGGVELRTQQGPLPGAGASRLPDPSHCDADKRPTESSGVEFVFTLSYEIDGEPRPACVADVIVLYP